MSTEMLSWLMLCTGTVNPTTTRNEKKRLVVWIYLTQGINRKWHEYTTFCMIYLQSGLFNLHWIVFNINYCVNIYLPYHIKKWPSYITTLSRDVTKMSQNTGKHQFHIIHTSINQLGKVLIYGTWWLKLDSSCNYY